MTSVPSVRKLATQGAAWVVFGYGGQQVLRFVNNLILTRLLVPEFFGIMALANTLRMGLELFSDVGIRQSVVRSPRGDDPIFIRTAWTVQALRGLILWLVCVALAYPAAQFYGESKLLILFPLVGLITVFNGLMSPAIFRITRHLHSRSFNLLSLGTALFGFCVMIGWASISPSVWALAGGGISGNALKLILGYVLFKEPIPKPAWEKEALAELTSFGRWIFVSAIMMFLAEQADRLVLGKIIPFQLLGVYTIAYSLANIPRALIKRLSSQILFPAISRKQDLPRDQLRRRFRRQRWKILLGSVALLSLLISFGDLVIGLLYDDRYLAATWMMPILCAGTWFVVLFYTLSPALLALGQPKFIAFSNFVSFAVIAFGVPLAHRLFDLPGAVTVISFSDLLPYFMLLWGLARQQLLCLVQDLLSSLLLVGMVAIFLGFRLWVGWGLPLDNLVL
ncbi:MAG: oligosaccharide flippase family protein [Cyanobacteria bacterium P01_G01_bin.54]